MSSFELGIVAIDGPAASGKSSTARAVADQLGLVHLNSGLLYRAASWIALRDGIDTDDRLAEALSEMDVTLNIRSNQLELRMNGELQRCWLHSEEVTARVSDVAADGGVRIWANGVLRGVAQAVGVVVDGRDIGTVVFPEARLKVFLTASAEERARRRLSQRGLPVTAGAVAREASLLRGRDQRDSSRIVAPLSRAEDAIEIDTTTRNREEVIREIVDIYRVRAASGQ